MSYHRLSGKVEGLYDKFVRISFVDDDKNQSTIKLKILKNKYSGYCDPLFITRDYAGFDVKMDKKKREKIEVGKYVELLCGVQVYVKGNTKKWKLNVSAIYDLEPTLVS